MPSYAHHRAAWRYWEAASTAFSRDVPFANSAAMAEARVQPGEGGKALSKPACSVLRWATAAKGRVRLGRGGRHQASQRALCCGGNSRQSQGAAWRVGSRVQSMERMLERLILLLQGHASRHPLLHAACPPLSARPGRQ